ncbi:MAG: hypothetical protein DMF54_12435 [Acidobacteria bacterium]|nr:MAG: hypothetical protein DMF54_12435 [Acidobacteriota bacterium]
MRTLPDSSAVVPIASGRRAVSRQRAFDSPRVQVPRRRLSRAAARASRGRQTRAGRDAFRVRGDGSSRDRARGAPPRIPSRGAPRGSGGEGARPFVLAAAPPQDSRDVAAERARPGAPPVERRGSVSSGGPVSRDSSPDRRRRDVGVDCARMRPGSRRGGRRTGGRVVLRARFPRRLRPGRKTVRLGMNLVNRLVVAAMPLVPRPVVRRIAHRYVAGETLEEALETVRALNDEGCMATLDVLGEDVEQREETGRTVDEYVRALDGIASRHLDSNVSVKLTALGLKIDREHCRREFDRIAEAARRHRNFVRIDMEDSSVTEATIRLFEEARRDSENVGLVLQAYLRRSRDDAARAAALRANVRVCKGIYVEPDEIAFQDREEIRDSYSSLVDVLLGAGCYVGIATHDPVLVERALATVSLLELPPEAYEFQMLLGVAGELRRRLVSAGHRLRVYVPYGEAWEAYSMRRLKENPAIAGHVVKGLFHRELRPRARPLPGNSN